MDCLICKKNTADKTGSHIIPHFILESYLNEPGVIGRDKGISFRLDETSSDFKFGREVIPEKQEKLLGREATEDEINESTFEQHHVEDYIFCSSCEKKLSYLESLYKSKVSGEIEKGNNLSADKIKIFHLFWLSVILRCSVSRKSNFALQPELEIKVRATINEILGNTVEKTENNCLTTHFPYKLQVFVNVTAPDKTSNCVLLHPVYKSPYLLFINEYILLFEFTNDSQIGELAEHLHIKVSSDHTELSYVSDKDWKNVRTFCKTIKAKQMYRATMDRFKKYYFEKHSRLPDETLVELFMNEFTSDNSTMEEVTKYSEARLKSLLEKYSA